MKVFLSIYLLCFSLICRSQNTLDCIDLSRIPQKKIRSLIKHQEENKILSFKELQATCSKGQNLSGYHMLKSVYLVKEDPETVWKTYQATSPAESWNGRMISFGLLVSKWKNNILYRNDPNFTSIDTGQVFYVNLKIMKGLYNLAVSLEIVDIDTIGKSIKFSYVKGGISRGEQTIYFVSAKEGYTEIIHCTAFKSDSYLRDRYLYPHFHRIAINEFHKNMKKRFSVEQKTIAKNGG
jgi:hypothetical protein